MPLLKLPNEILIQIAECLDPKDFTNFLVLNRFFKSLSTPLLRSIAFSDPAQSLDWACKRGHEHLARLLLEGGTSTSVQSLISRPRYPLQEAAYHGHLPIVKLLLQYGADISARDDDGGTALHYAAGSGHPTVVQLLLENGADKEINSDMLYNVTPLMWAIKGLETAYALNLEKANPKCTLDYYWNEEGFIDTDMFSHIELTEHRNNAMARMYEVVSILLDRGADVTYSCNTGESVLHAVAGVEKFDAVDTAELLLEWGADLHAVDNEGITPLHMAAYSGLPGIATLFLEKGGVVNAEDSHGRTPRDIMVVGFHPEVRRLLERAQRKAQEVKRDKA
ncbi:ankyrin repeat-containing domain protein [Morchella snyderi]|nr:ankyrin repeat-containing domain protein [Morchella snyderi]